MRPKKRILLIHSDEQRQGEISFLLRTRAYAVFPASSSSEALDCVGHSDPEVIVIDADFIGIRALLPAIRERAPWVPQLVLASGCSAPPPDLYPDASLYGRFTSPELLDRLKVLAARKRGPKKMPPRSVSLKAAGIEAPIEESRTA